jgi:hypothetical protein
MTGVREGQGLLFSAIQISASSTPQKTPVKLLSWKFLDNTVMTMRKEYQSNCYDLNHVGISGYGE